GAAQQVASAAQQVFSQQLDAQQPPPWCRWKAFASVALIRANRPATINAGRTLRNRMRGLLQVNIKGSYSPTNALLKHEAGDTLVAPRPSYCAIVAGS